MSSEDNAEVIRQLVNNATPAGESVSYRKLSDIQSVPIHWLWSQRIAHGKITVLAGDPGLGKSQLTAFLAATVSNGGSFPFDRTYCTQGNVIFLNAEDDAADTIKPRLEAVGADMDRIYILDAVTSTDDEGNSVQRGFNLKQDLGSVLIN